MIQKNGPKVYPLSNMPRTQLTTKEYVIVHMKLCLALFIPKRGIASLFLPGNQITNIETQEEREEILNSFEGALDSGHIPIGNDTDNQNSIQEELQPRTSSSLALTKQEYENNQDTVQVQQQPCTSSSQALTKQQHGDNQNTIQESQH